MGNNSSKKNNNSTSSSSFYEHENKEERDEIGHLIHVLVKEIFKTNFSSNINKVLLDRNTKILDIGCGSGFWLMEMAADYPKPSYFGIDVLPVFPKTTHPKNIKFIQHDILKGLPFDDNTFDYIHLQFLCCEFLETQWENDIFKELERVLKPGGWLENCDMEFGVMRGGPMTKKIDTAVLNHLITKKINPYMIIRNQSFFETVPSFSTSVVYHEKRKYPLGPQSSNIGNLCASHIKERYRLILQSPIGQDMLNIKKKEINSIIDEVSKEFETNESYYFIHRFYVQKEEYSSFIKKRLTY